MQKAEGENQEKLYAQYWEPLSDGRNGKQTVDKSRVTKETVFSPFTLARILPTRTDRLALKPCASSAGAAGSAAGARPAAAPAADAVVQRHSPRHVCTAHYVTRECSGANEPPRSPRAAPTPSSLCAAPLRSGAGAAGAAGAAGPAAPRAGAGAERSGAEPPPRPRYPRRWRGNGLAAPAPPPAPAPRSPCPAPRRERRAPPCLPRGAAGQVLPLPPLEQPGFWRLCFLGRRWEWAGCCSCRGCGASPCSRGVSARQITDADVKKGQSRGEASVDASAFTDGLRRWRLPAWCWRGECNIPHFLLS